MTSIWTSVKPLTPSNTTYFSPNLKDMDLMGGQLDGWGTGCKTAHSNSQWLNVWVKISREKCPLVVCIGSHALQHFHQWHWVRLSTSSTSSCMTSRCVVQSTRMKNKMPSKWKILHLSRGNPCYCYKLGKERNLHNPDKKKKTWTVLMNGKLDVSQKFFLVTQKVNHVLGCIKNSVASRSRKVILPF